TFQAFGCPECVHMHWRWTSVIDRFTLGAFGYGYPIVGSRFDYLPTNQDLDIGVALYKPNNSQELHPQSFYSLINNERIRTPVIRYTLPSPRFPSRPIRVLGPSDVVFWYSGTGYTDADLFFKHGLFFNPTDEAGRVVTNQGVT